MNTTRRGQSLLWPYTSGDERLLGALTFRRADGSLGIFRCDTDVPTRIFTRHRFTIRPRHVDRPFRTDDDEPATGMSYRLTDRQCACNDGRDRSKCSSCRQPVYRNTSQLEKHRYDEGRRFDGSRAPSSRLPPERVFRDLVMSDVEEPLTAASRDALLAAFGQTVMTEPPPSTSPAEHFELFPMLPFEIRRIIWEMALPERVLLGSDLSDPYDGQSILSRPARPSLDALRHSDLFNACREARSVVESFDGGSRRIGITSEARLLASKDLLYHPWRGSGTGQRWTKWASRSDLALECLALDVGWLDKYETDSLEWLADDTSLASVKVVVADILVPVRIPLGPGSPLWAEALGMDFTVLVGLYDNTRIEEILSLQGLRLSSPLNKAAKHRCIACTRRAWEARDWSVFGENFGNKLKRLSCPSIVFSVVMEFVRQETD